MTLDKVQGQSRAVETLRSALRTGSIHHGYLFAGPEGVGKELTARAFVQALLCSERPNEGCGSCATCGRVERGNHPDVTWVMPEAEQVARKLAGRSDFDHTPSRELRVEQIRQLQERLALRPLEGNRKVAILVSAQEMNVPAQNAFLKTLEEPPSGALLILLAENADTLLPTIRSRCSRVHFGPLPTDFVAGQVAKVRELESAVAELVAHMAGGSLSRALAYDVDGLVHRKDLFTLFEAVSQERLGVLLGFAEVYGSSREEAEDALKLLLVWLRDVAVVQAGGDVIANRDLLPALQEAASRRSELELHQRARLVGETLRAIERNGSPRLQLEKMLIEMTGGAR